MSASTPSGAYEFGDFVLDAAHRSLTRGGPGQVAITGKAFDALVYLVEHAGQIVTRQELATALWPTTIVEDNNLSQTILALRRVLGDTQDGSRYVVTVPRRGYQFVADVRRGTPIEAAAHAERSVTAGPALAESATAATAPLRQRRAQPAVLAYGVLALALILGGRLIFEKPRGRAVDAAAVPEAEAALPRSVAVLPFENLSPSADDAYFAAGIHEEVLNQLAKMPGVNVIARTSVMQYANGVAPIAAIAAKLRAAAIVEGSVRYAAERVRVSVRLVDAATSTEVWSETYDADVRDVFDVQTAIASRVAQALGPELAATQTTSARKPTESATAYAAYLRMLSLYRTHGGIGVTMPLQIRQTMRELLDQAIALDPRFAAALAWRANLNMDAMLFDPRPEQEWQSGRAELMRRIDDDAQRALSLDPAQGTAHATLARLNLYRWRLDDALATLERAVQLNPNDSVVLHYRAMAALVREENADAIRFARHALDLDPKNPAPHTPLSMALRATGDHAGAIAAYEDMIEVAPTAAIGYIGLARTLTTDGDADRITDALRLAEQFLGDSQNFRVDAALSYASIGARADAERLIAEFRHATAGYRVDPGLAAMADLALGDHERAYERIRNAIADRTGGMDPLPLLQIRENTWTDSVLEEPMWLALRADLGYEPPAPPAANDP